ncbi:MAG: LysE family transporter [Chloroflexi bacterium]|nr:LysE family transporter [Chloroflexota bacterium]
MVALIARGISIGFAAGMTPGPLQIFMLMQTLRYGARHALWLVLAPLMSDAPVVTIVLLILGQASKDLLNGISLVGGLFVLYIAWELWQQLRSGVHLPAAETFETAETGRQPIYLNLRKAVIINALGPGAWLFWGTVLGPLVIEAWRDTPTRAITFVFGFYGMFLLTMAGLVIAFHQARRLGTQAINIGLWIGLVVLVGFGVSLIWDSLQGFGIL